MDPNSTTAIDIDAMSKDRPASIAGKVHSVKPMSAKMLTVIRGEGDNVEKLLTVVGNRVPTLTPDEIGELTVAQLEAIIDQSLKGMKAVEQANPNGEPPATTAATPASSSSG